LGSKKKPKKSYMVQDFHFWDMSFEGILWVNGLKSRDFKGLME
jgi:hypothetical protein